LFSMFQLWTSVLKHGVGRSLAILVSALIQTSRIVWSYWPSARRLAKVNFCHLLLGMWLVGGLCVEDTGASSQEFKQSLTLEFQAKSWVYHHGDNTGRGYHHGDNHNPFCHQHRRVSQNKLYCENAQCVFSDTVYQGNCHIRQASLSCLLRSCYAAIGFVEPCGLLKSSDHEQAFEVYR